MKKKKFFLFWIFLLLFLPISSWAYWVWSPEAGKFVNTEGAVQDAADEQYNSAMQFYKEKNLDAASEHLENLLKKYPSARVSSEAQYRLGVVYEEKGDYRKAFQAYKALLQSYPQSDRLSEVIEREYRIGNLFLSGKKGKLMGLEILPSLPRAVEVFRHIVEQAPYSDYGDKAQFRLGIAYKQWKRYDEALQAFQAVIDQYPQSDLVPDARFQLAETSFLRSSAEYRDQRALDEASTQVDKFLTRYPDTSTTEKAAKLRQEIDEKNAEKNYRIGLYYEKENYLESALIYYSDVSARYPHTQWGQKAADKLKSLREPVSYLSGQEDELKKQVQTLEAKFKGLTDQDSLERDQLKRQLERLRERQKSIEKNKGESLERREDDIKRRERELKTKFKKLAKKKKLLKKNPSEDLKLALERWTASLETEQAQLAEEKKQLTDWRETLGVKTSRFISLEFLPFMGEVSSELEKVRHLEARKFYKLSGEKKVLLSEKEILYKHHSEVTALLQDLEAKRLGVQNDQLEFQGIAQVGGEKLKARHDALKEAFEDIKQLERELEEKKWLYGKRFGKQGWLSWTKVPGHVVSASAGLVGQSLNRSFDMLNPFDSKSQNLEDETLEELLERQMHLKEKMAAQQSLVETLSRAFDVELALQEQKKLLQIFEQEEKVDPRALRKSIKRLEKDIRSRFEEIEDRHERKKKLLKELDDLLKKGELEKGVGLQAARAVSSPVVGFLKVSKAFLFGLPNEDVALAKSAETLTEDTATAQKAKEIKEQLEMESLLIEAKNREIATLQKELEIFKAKASLAGGLKFRSAFVTWPYQFVKEAIESAHRMVPKKNREEMLIGLLDHETRELEILKAEVVEVDAAIDRKSAPQKLLEEELSKLPDIPESEETAEKGEAQAKREIKEREKSPEALALREEIRQGMKKLEIRRRMYQRERTLLEMEWQALKKEVGEDPSQKAREKEAEKIGEQEEQLRKELKEIKEDLGKLIRKESELEKEESLILEKRIHRIDQVIQKVHSKVLMQDLLTERERMENRVSQLELRRDFLSKEMERFKIVEPRASNP